MSSRANAGCDQPGLIEQVNNERDGRQRKYQQQNITARSQEPILVGVPTSES